MTGWALWTKIDSERLHMTLIVTVTHVYESGAELFHKNENGNRRDAIWIYRQAERDLPLSLSLFPMQITAMSLNRHFPVPNY